MSGRNTHPDRDGERSSPSRLDQFGETLANDNDEAEDLAAGVRARTEGPENGACGYPE
ncbi:hypothetical protein [Paenibacillus alkalitolerans]|uniref:hypothetical protein n=1 Tax=Paenibacillus alkalitolerans TaxID=2799335 RepID=UPI0018F4A43D|nr:hypothetical protein [Paenibacillus alkalitolerans]